MKPLAFFIKDYTLTQLFLIAHAPTAGKSVRDLEELDLEPARASAAQVSNLGHISTLEIIDILRHNT